MTGQISGVARPAHLPCSSFSSSCSLPASQYRRLYVTCLLLLLSVLLLPVTQVECRLGRHAFGPKRAPDANAAETEDDSFSFLVSLA